jgi:hypothetical protein
MLTHETRQQSWFSAEATYGYHAPNDLRSPAVYERVVNSIFNMSPSLNPLELVRKRNKDRTSETIDMIDSSRRFYRTIGSVTFSILLKPNTVTYVYDKVIEPIVAERLAKLEMANEVFTLDIYANANIINEFSDAASLEDILDLGEDCWFAPEHCQMFATDVGTPRYLIMQR